MKNIPADLVTHYQSQVQTTTFCCIIALAMRQPRVVNITQTNPAVVTTLWPHHFKSGEVVKFVAIEGMSEINFVPITDEKYFVVTPLSSTTFAINTDASGFSAYLAGSTYGQARRVLGFTAFERNLHWNGVVLQAKTGAQDSAIETTSDFNFSSRDIHALLNSEQIRDVDVEQGLYSGAEVETFEVNYRDLTQGRNVLQYGRIGDIQWGDNTFIAEMLGLLSQLAQQQGPNVSITCRAQLGTRISDTYDERYGCKVKLNPPAWVAGASHVTLAPYDAGIGSVVKPTVYNGFHYQCTAGGISGSTEPVWPTVVGGTITDGSCGWIAIDARTKYSTVNVVSDRRTFFDTTRTEADEWFTHGLLTFLTGENAGFASEVKQYSQTPYPIVLADVFNHWFYIAGDYTAYISIGDIVTVTGAGENDGTKNVTEVIYDSGTARTRITTLEPVPVGAGGGILHANPPRFVLRDAMFHDIHVGDQYEVEVGCDKRLDTCVTKFDNVYNFRGEPYIPGIHEQYLYPDGVE